MNGSRGRRQQPAPSRNSGGQRNQGSRRKGRRSRSVERAMPVATSYSVGPTGPPGMGSRQGWTSLAHKEVILQVTASTSSDTILTIPVIPNLLYPPNSTTYSGRAKFLAGHAPLYSQHKWDMLAFQWTPSCPTTTPGNVVLRFIPNYTTPTPTNMLDTMDSDAYITSPFQGGYYTPRIKRAVIYNTAPQFSSIDDVDKCDYSCGKLIVAVNKQALALTVGTVTMHYRVLFRGPVTPADASAS